MQLYGKMQNHNRGSNQADLIQGKIDSLSRVMLHWQHDYFAEKPSILGLFLYYEVLRNQKEFSKEDLAPSHDFWKDQYPGNSLTPVVMKIYTAVELSKFQNIDLLFLNGKEGDLASLVRTSEYTLLDL